MHPSFSKRSIVATSLGIAAGAAIMLGVGLQAQPTNPSQPAGDPQPAEATQPPAAQPEPQPEPKVSSMVATYDPRAVFDQSERSTRLTEQLMALQGQMQQAQAAGDGQAMGQLQQQAQQLQQTEVQGFLDELEAILPEVAKESGFTVVAIDFAYLDESLGQPADLTAALCEKID
jgi:hypothetical protein